MWSRSSLHFSILGRNDTGVRCSQTKRLHKMEGGGRGEVCVCSGIDILVGTFLWGNTVLAGTTCPCGNSYAVPH